MSIRGVLQMKDDQLSNERIKSLIHTSEELISLDYKKELDISSTKDKVEISKDIVAMANTSGGHLIIGVDDDYNQVGLASEIARSIDGSDIDNKVNSLVEPRIDGIRYKTYEEEGKYFGVIYVPKSQFAPHVVKKDGTYSYVDSEDKERNKTVFKRGDIYVRHSGGKSEPITYSDISRLIDERVDRVRKKWMKGIQQVVEAPESAKFMVISGEIRETDDPDTPKRSAFRLDTDKYETLDQELIAGIKAWKSHQVLLTQPQLADFYANRTELRGNSERLELMIRSSFELRMPAFYWCSKTDRSFLMDLVEEAIKTDSCYSTDALIVVLALGSERAKNLLHSSTRSKLIRNRNRAKAFLNIIDFEDRMDRFIKKKLNNARYVRNKGDERKTIRIKDILDDKEELETLASEIADSLAKGNKNSLDKMSLKQIDIILYAGGLP